MWQVAARPVVEYGSEVWACSSEHSEQKLKVLQERVGRAFINRGKLAIPRSGSERRSRAGKYEI